VAYWNNSVIFLNPRLVFVRVVRRFFRQWQKSNLQNSASASAKHWWMNTVRGIKVTSMGVPSSCTTLPSTNNLSALVSKTYTATKFFKLRDIFLEASTMTVKTQRASKSVHARM